MSQRPTEPDADWIARHARCRPGSDVPSVVLSDEPPDDWPRRHAETRRAGAD